MVVGTPGGTAAPLPFTYVVVAPTATGLDPATGPTGGGTTVTVTGGGFVPGGTTVTIGGVVVPADQVTVVDASTLTFVTPPHAAGTVGVVVTTEGGASGELRFRYGTPTSGSAASGSGSRSGPSGLAYTGADLALPVLGGGLALLAGLALTVGARRRRTA
ncbi:hypothetical protein GCM10023162_39440 [Klenkia terrae]